MNTTSPKTQQRTYEVIAWRPETYTTSDEFTADSPEQALAMAKAAFADESGDSCLTCEGWDEFSVTFDGDQVLSECPPNRTGELLAFATRIAGMSQDGEEVDGREFVIENDDAVSTLNDLIDEARRLVVGAESEDA